MSLMMRMMEKIEKAAMESAMLKRAIDTINESAKKTITNGHPDYRPMLKRLYQQAIAAQSGIQKHSIGENFPYSIATRGDGMTIAIIDGQTVIGDESEVMESVNFELYSQAENWFSSWENRVEKMESEAIETLAKFGFSDPSQEYEKIEDVKLQLLATIDG